MNKEIKIPLVLLGLNTSSYLINYSLNVILARHLSAHIYGDYSVAIKVLTIMVELALFGTQVGTKRFLAKYLDLNRREEALNYLAWNTKLLSVTFFISIIIALTTFIIMNYLHYLGIKHIEDYHLAAYTLWLVPFFALVIALSSLLLLSERIYFSAMVTDFLNYFLQVFLFFMVIVFVGPTLSNSHIVTVLFTTFMLLILIAFFLLNKEIINLIKQSIKKARTISLTKGKWLKTSAGLIVNNIILAVFSAIDLFIVELFASSEGAVGHYAAILVIIGFLWMIPPSVLQPLKRNLATHLDSLEGRKQLQEKLKTTNKLIISLVLCVGLLIILFSRQLLNHYGPEYVQAYPALIILTIGMMGACISRIAPVILVFAGYERLLLQLGLVELILIILLAIPATYYFDITGTAVITSLVFITKAVVIIITIRKKLGIKVWAI